MLRAILYNSEILVVVLLFVGAELDFFKKCGQIDGKITTGADNVLFAFGHKTVVYTVQHLRVIREEAFYNRPGYDACGRATLFKDLIQNAKLTWVDDDLTGSRFGNEGSVAMEIVRESNQNVVRVKGIFTEIKLRFDLTVQNAGDLNLLVTMNGKSGYLRCGYGNYRRRGVTGIFHHAYFSFPVFSTTLSHNFTFVSTILRSFRKYVYKTSIYISVFTSNIFSYNV
jgi:hypothetical protein